MPRSCQGCPFLAHSAAWAKKLSGSPGAYRLVVRTISVLISPLTPQDTQDSAALIMMPVGVSGTGISSSSGVCAAPKTR